MRKDLTHVTLLVDRSGSMKSCLVEAQDGANQFIKDQKDEDGDCTLTLIEFNQGVNIVYDGIDIYDVPKYKLSPSGMTNLTDAFGMAIDHTGDYLSSIPEADRPGLVVFGILTDGEETISPSEYSHDRVRNMVELQQGTYSWQFTYLGANQNAFKQAGKFSIEMGAVANYTVADSASAFQGLSNNVRRMRKNTSKGLLAVNEYTSDERRAMEGQNS